MAHFSTSAREYLEWSWNYARAEELAEYSTKEVARSISSGIDRGEDVIEENLVEDFLDKRVDDLEAMTLLQPEQWTPLDAVNRVPDSPFPGLSMEKLVAELRSFPDLDLIIAEVKSRRDEDD
jgi:hypothetical protein